jgi:hypothetical protein
MRIELISKIKCMDIKYCSFYSKKKGHPIRWPFLKNKVYYFTTLVNVALSKNFKNSRSFAAFAFKEASLAIAFFKLLATASTLSSRADATALR